MAIAPVEVAAAQIQRLKELAKENFNPKPVGFQNFID
jgi:hypothetical protein